MFMTTKNHKQSNQQFGKRSVKSLKLMTVVNTQLMRSGREAETKTLFHHRHSRARHCYMQ